MGSGATATVRGGRRAGRDAFTTVELLVVVAIIAVLTTLSIVAVGRTRASSRNMACLANLGQIAAAFHLYLSEHADRYPDPAAAGTTWEATLRADLPDAKVYLCPADGELGPATGSSYDWRDTGIPATTLAGQPAAAVARLDAVLAFESLPGWHAKGRMNVARVDGSCATVDDQRGLADLLKPIR